MLLRGNRSCRIMNYPVMLVASMLSRLDRGYGGKRPFLFHLITSVQTQLPPWNRLRRPEWHRVERFVFVCNGNICRSPYAAAKAASLGLRSASAGLATKNGCPASEAARKHALWRGLYSRPIERFNSSSLC